MSGEQVGVVRQVKCLRFLQGLLFGDEERIRFVGKFCGKVSLKMLNLF